MHVAIEAACSGSPPQCSTFSYQGHLSQQSPRVVEGFDYCHWLLCIQWFLAPKYLSNPWKFSSIIPFWDQLLCLVPGNPETCSVRCWRIFIDAQVMQNSLAKLIACIVGDHRMVWDPTPPEIYKLLDFLKDKRLKSRIDSA